MDQHSPSRMAIVVSSLMIGAAIVAGSAIFAQAFYQLKASGNTIGVTGSVERAVTSDTVKWTSVITKSVDVAGLKDGSAQMRTDVANAVASLKSAGIAENTILVQPMSVSAVCENQGSLAYDKGGVYCGSGRVGGYNLQQMILVESHDVGAVTKSSRETPSKLLGDGIVYSTVSLEYFFSKLDELKLDLLAEATKNAKLRADRIAQSTGSRIGKIQQAAQGVFQMTAVNSIDISDYGAYDTSSLEKKVTAVVKTTFTLE